MNRKSKVDYINKVFERFEHAENHGNNGSNWWNALPFRIAYNVKMSSFGDIDTFRKYLTPLQNKHYTDDDLYEHINFENEVSANMLIEDIHEEFGLDASFAGRSGGWIEIDYPSNFEDVTLEDDDDTINGYYYEAKELEELEAKVSNFIKDQHKGYNDYVDTKQYYQDLLERLDGDFEIYHQRPLYEFTSHKNDIVKRHAKGIIKELSKE